MPTVLIPVDNDPRLVTTTSIWDRLSPANSIVTTNLRRIHNVILIAAASLDTISKTPLRGSLTFCRSLRCSNGHRDDGVRRGPIYTSHELRRFSITLSINADYNGHSTFLDASEADLGFSDWTPGPTAAPWDRPAPSSPNGVPRSHSGRCASMRVSHNGSSGRMRHAATRVVESESVK